MIYEKISKFYEGYNGRKCVIGYSFRGKEIYAMHVGSPTGRQFILTYAIHGILLITAKLALKHIKIGVKKGGGWIIPLVNPDGAAISEDIRPMWKANARGVDLNCNFDADWGSGRLNTKRRGAENCIGRFQRVKRKRLKSLHRKYVRLQLSVFTPKAKKSTGSITVRVMSAEQKFLPKQRVTSPC